jgi:hypothetical protein
MHSKIKVIAESRTSDFESKKNMAKSLPRLWHGSEFACPTIFTYHLEENTIRTIYREAKVSKTLSIIRKFKTGILKKYQNDKPALAAK